MNGIDKARAVADKLKAETTAAKESEAKDKAVAINQLTALGQNGQLAQMYRDSAKVGAANLAGELPLLKVHTVDKSKNTLPDGTEPNNGWFFYKPTGEQFETLECHILTISKGFRAEGINGKQNVFNQIVGGIIKDGTNSKPFIMYFTGKKLSYLWEFGKAASKYTHAKPIPIPMFALTIKLSTERQVNEYGKSWIVNFEIKKSEDGSPELVMDPGEFQFLKDSAETVEDTIVSLIDAKATKEDEDVATTPIKESEDQAIDPETGLPF